MAGIEFARVSAIDTHTGGEPTRIIVAGGPDLGSGPLAERRERFKASFDYYRSAFVNEPRGSDVMVGALLVSPHDSSATAGVIFFNNIGYLGMCGHGTMGVAVALAHLGCIGAGRHRLDTPVGTVAFEIDNNNRVAVENVASYRLAHGVEVDVPGHGTLTGDVAWGGNWFFLIKDHGQILDASHTDELTEFTWRIRQALVAAEITGSEGAEIDHIELFGPSHNSRAQSRNFVLCPGKAYDRSPCGTGTSAKIACLAADEALQPGEVWRQESIIGSVFEASYHLDEIGRCVPTIRGQAFVNAETTILIDRRDPFAMGIRH